MSRWHKTEFDLYPELAFKPRGGRCFAMTLEGGGGGYEAPPPDPALIAAQIKSMGIQDEMLQSIIANSNEMLPLQKQQTEFGLRAAQTAYDQSQEDRVFMLDRRGQLSEMQDQLVQDAKSFDSEAKANELARKAQASVQQSFDNTEAQQMRSLSRMGVNPNSGKFAAMSNQNSLAKASASAGAANNARTQAEDMGYKLTDRATNALAGYPSLGMTATGQGAQYGGLGLNTVNAGLQGMNSGFSQGAIAAGSSAQGYGNIWGQQNDAYQASQNASNAASAGLGQAVGTLGTMWAMNGFPSDRRLKTEIKAVGSDERTGLTLYQFRYIDGGDTVYQGVMADEVAVRYPDAVVQMPDGYQAVNYAALGIEFKPVEEAL